MKYIEFIENLNKLEKNREYLYVPSSTSSEKKFYKLLSVAEDSIIVERDGKEIKVSIRQIKQVLDNLKLDKALDIERVLGASGNTRSIIESLLCMMPTIFYTKINKRKHIYESSLEMHELGILTGYEFGVTVDKLGTKLKLMYENADDGFQVAAIHMFGIEYAPQIIDNFTPSEIIKAAGIKESYTTELAKGINIYKCLTSGKYDLRYNQFNKAESLSGGFNVNNAIKLNVSDSSMKGNFSLRYITSLLSKPFTILAGNSGTGKTKIAKDLAIWLGKKDENTNTIANKLIVPVGSDWTDNTKILGFYNPLKKTYESTKILDFILLARDNPEIPFFLILDEMNLSHVERYFSDFLSAMESHEKIILYSKDEDCDSDIPESIDLPENLFVTGTVNIDETTYMFSPKVLDRANVIEFIPARSDVLSNFAAETQPIEIEPVNDGSAEGFLALAKTVRETTTLPAGSDICKTILEGISNILDGSGFEFAFRTAKEIRLYINAAYALAQNEGKTLSEEDYVNLMDEQLLQKVLPKVHGNRKQIGTLLEKFETFCAEKSLPLSLAKVQKMKVRLENYQYASFI